MSHGIAISRVAVGDGEAPDGTNLAMLTSLVHEVARSQATYTTPIVEDDTLTFEIEYRNKWEDDTFGDGYTDPTGLTEGFWLKEYGVFALDANGNEIMLYYASLADFPEPVARWNGRNLVSKRYPVEISLVDDDTDIQLMFPARASVTSEYLEQRLSAFEGAGKAEKIKYDDSETGLGAVNVQEAVEKLAGGFAPVSDKLRAIEEQLTGLSSAGDRKVIAARIRDPSKPSYGLGEPGGGGVTVAVSVEAAPYTGTAEITIADGGTEYDVNMSTDGENAPDGAMIIKHVPAV